MPNFDPYVDVEGFAEAVAKEQFDRDAAFLGLPETVCGFELVPMTLRHWLILRMTRNRVLLGLTPTPDEVIRFVWLLNPKYRPKAALRRAWISYRVLRLRRSLTKSAALLVALRQYVEDTWADAPPSSSTGDKSYYSSGSYLVWTLGNMGIADRDRTLDMQMKEIFGYLAVARDANPLTKAPMSNPSDKKIGEWIYKKNTQGVQDASLPEAPASTPAGCATPAGCKNGRTA